MKPPRSPTSGETNPYIGHVTRIVTCPGCKKLQPYRDVRQHNCSKCKATKEAKLKRFYMSRTFWANLILGGALIAEGVTGQEVVIPIEIQVGILALVNLALRKVTKEPVSW